MPEMAHFLPNPASPADRTEDIMPSELAKEVRCYTQAQTGSSPFETAIPGLTLLRADHPKPPSHLIFKPALCVVVQGAKWAIFGGRRVDYRAGQALVVSVETPGFGSVAEATAAEPYLSLVIEFDLGRTLTVP